ncbi:MAG: histidine phosphatase family protein [Pseudomonadales bacterium]|nr:histidine phosphatase family protein [Pseudomonadales bacterium]
MSLTRSLPLTSGMPVESPMLRSARVMALLRHGDYLQPENVPSAHLPWALTAEGERQAAEAAQQIRVWADRHGLLIASRIVTSRQLRAWQTGRIIADCLAITEIEENPALAERSVGSVANLTVEEISAVASQDPRIGELPDNWKSDSYYRLPFQGAESLMEAGQRVATALKEAMQGINPGELQIVVGHGASIRHAMTYLDLLKPHEVAGLSMYHCQPVWLSQSADGQWSHIDGAWKVRRSEAFRD